MTNFARDISTAAPAEPDALIRTLYEDLSRLPASAQLDATLCLLEAATLMLPTLPPARGRPADAELDDIRAAMRAASLSVRSYLWRTGANGPVDPPVDRKRVRERDRARDLE
ncbi:hypothetical protein AB0O07_09520 [Streptomyces sp. NPDC093085]|uniref:hypothetical protein n=1 Tax=Streptomyces sp. NPDC093085 TaxID=3155068 RepID=UPI003427F1DE